MRKGILPPSCGSSASAGRVGREQKRLGGEEAAGKTVTMAIPTAQPSIGGSGRMERGTGTGAGVVLHTVVQRTSEED